MQKADPLIRTKLRLPFTRPGLVPRSRLEARIMEGLRGPLTLITAPAGFGKTTLVASCVAGCGMPLAWLSLDKNDNQSGRFLGYLVAALQEADPTIGSEAAELLAAQQAPPEAVLTSLINDLDTTGRAVALVLDDYQFISSQVVHAAVIFLLEHCPRTFHLLIATRSDPPLPLARLRVRGQTVELRAADLRFTEPEAAQFLNDVMSLRLDAGSVAVLVERTEGWIAGLQMAALSMRDRKDVLEFLKGFSGTNRYILEYLLEEVLASQPPEIQHFLLYTSILERLTAPLCDAVLGDWEIGKPVDCSSITSLPVSQFTSNTILDYLERANLFLVPLDDERRWYRYRHLFAGLLRLQLQKSLEDHSVTRLHLRAAAWHERNGLILEAIHHASMAADDELVERLIKQNYLEMMNRGELSWVRFWMGNLSKDLIYRRPWLCLYEAMNRSWFGQLEEASILLDEAEKRIRAEGSAPGAKSMLGYHAYVKSRVTAMQGDIRRAIKYCLTARENVPADSLDLQIDFSITLGYEYFLCGDFVNANKILNETIRLGYITRAINNPVAAYCLLARSQVYQGQLYEAYDLLKKAEQLIPKAGGQYLGSVGLVEVETAALLCEWNDVEAALVHVKGGLDYLPWWGKADDFCLAYITLARIQLALGNRTEAAGAIEKAAQLVQTCGVFSEARNVLEAAQVKMWLIQADWSAVDRWASTLEKRCDAVHRRSPDRFRFEDELTHITQARVLITLKKLDEAIRLLSYLEETARSGGRQGRLIEILILEAVAMQAMREPTQAYIALTKSLALAEPEGYLRIFLDVGEPARDLLDAYIWSAAPDHQLYARKILDAFSRASQASSPGPQPAGLVEPLTGRELEVLQLLARGFSNRQVAEALVLSEGTVKFHVHSILEKIQVHSRTEAIVKAQSLRLI